MDWLKSLLGYIIGLFKPVASTDHSETTIYIKTEPPVTKAPTLLELCEAMRDFEGKPGDPNYRNNNPLNFKCSPDGYLAMYGHVGCSTGGFAQFKDWGTGWLYAQNALKAKIHNHPNWTISDLIENHAPRKKKPTDDVNNTDDYIAFVCKRLGVDKTFKVALLG